MRKLLFCLSAGLILTTLAAPPVARSQALVTSEPHLAIPDEGGGPACVDTLSFSQSGDAIGAFRVGLAIQHTYQAQLRVLLLPPGVVWPGASYDASAIPAAVAAGAIELVANAGGSSDSIGQALAQPYDYSNFTTSGDPVFDAGFTAMSIDTAPDATGLSGTWLAHDEVALESVYGSDPADFGGQGGTWTLVVIDDTATQDGTLVAWQLEYDVVVVDPPEILVLRGGPIPDGGDHDLGVLTAGVPEAVTFNVGNTGLGVLHVTGVATTAATNCTVTAITSVPFAVDPSDASPLELLVTPLGDGPFAFDLRLDNDDADENPYRIHVTGTAELAPFGVLLVSGVTVFEAPALSSPVSEDWLVENLGSEELIVEAITLEGADASGFALGGVPGLPLALAPGASANLSVIYLALSTGDASAAVRFVSSSGTTPDASEIVQVTGTVTPDATQTGTPELVVVGTTSFRAVEAGAFDSAMWSVSNSGDADLVITNVDTLGSHAGAFAVSGMSLPATIPPGGSVSLQVFFAPTAARAHAAVIRFTSNHGAVDGTTTEVPVTGFITGKVEDPGCNCSNATSGGPGSGMVLGLFVLMVLGWRRRHQGSNNMRRWMLPLLCGLWVIAGCGDDDGSAGNQNNGNQTNSNQTNGNEPAAYGMCGTWIEGDSDADDGATRDYYNRGASLPWRNYLGDWHDASDIAQGDAPFALTTLVDDNTPNYVTWDVTTLVQAWVDGDYHPRGFHLRAVGGDGTYNFYAREHPVASERPELVIVTGQGDTVLSPEADTYLAPSTYQSSGDDVQLSISTERPVLVRFDLSGLDPAEAVLSATLRLYEYEDYGGGTLDVGVFRSSQGLDEPDDGPEMGLAAAYPGDAGISDDPDVLLFSDFESADWGLDWSTGQDAATLELVTDDPGNQFAPHQGQALRILVPGGEHTGMALTFKFADEVGEEPEEIYFRYYLRIGDDWWPDFGGKLPGISGTYGVAGWGGRPSDGTDGWSARGTFELPVADGNPYGGHTPIGSYVYHADMEGTYGDVDLWIRGCRGILQRNQWYAVEQYLRMNTPGETDGVLRAWVDGRLAYERTDWRWRHVDTLKIEQIWMNVYHGGTVPAPADIHLYIDNVVIARQYIGPMATP